MELSVCFCTKCFNSVIQLFLIGDHINSLWSRKIGWSNKYLQLIKPFDNLQVENKYVRVPENYLEICIFSADWTYLVSSFP